jgi:Domain of unknown function (DUF6438)
MSGRWSPRARTLAAAWLVAMWLPAACARTVRPSAEPDTRSTPVAPATGSVSLERGPCFGTCPVYKVTVDRSGAVRFEGRRFVADTGVSTGTASLASVDSLFAELEGAGYFGFADSYRMGQPGCERYATDLPTVITEVRLGDRAKRVEHDRGCADAPAALSVLESRIDAVAGVGRWVGR